MGKIIRLRNCCGTVTFRRCYYIMNKSVCSLMSENPEYFGNLSLSPIDVEFSSGLLPDFKICTEVLAILCFKKIRNGFE